MSSQNPPPEPPPPGFEPDEASGSNPVEDPSFEAVAYATGVQATTARRHEFRRQEIWKYVVYGIRVAAIVIPAFLITTFVIMLAVVVGWLAYLVVIHYTAPKMGWLTPEELQVLGGLYANAAKIVAPLALITNAWLVAYISLRRWRAATQSSARDNWPR